MLVIAVVNLKGGSTKTTTAGFLAAALHESGMSVLGVDTDDENRGLLRWQADADLPWPVIAMMQPHKQLAGLASSYDVVVIDTPPMQAQRGTVLSAARLADRVVVPLYPNHAEYQRVPHVLELLEEAASVRADSTVPPWRLLFTRCPGGRAAAPKVYREIAEQDGYRVLAAQVGRSDVLAQAQGSPIKSALATKYGDAALELLEG